MRVTGNPYEENVMTSEMLQGDKYLSIINKKVSLRFLEGGARPLRGWVGRRNRLAVQEPK